ncbi:hypothetical protein Phab24_id024 [Acinetobacter phage Phab24]|nr:hypothetical protein Phab24_id024 [Acinetobacter phage Phab24]
MKYHDDIMEMFHSNQGKLTIQDAYYQSNTEYVREDRLFYVYLFYKNNKILYVHYGLKGTEKIHYTKDSPVKQFRNMVKCGTTEDLKHYKLTRFSVEADCLFYVDFLIKKFSPEYNKKIRLPSETYYNKQTRFISDYEVKEEEDNLIALLCHKKYRSKLISDMSSLPVDYIQSIKNKDLFFVNSCFFFEYVDINNNICVDKNLVNFFCDVYKSTLVSCEAMDTISYH